MGGGKGNDTYFVDEAGDKIIELVNGGGDKVIASANYTLGASAYIETLQAITASDTQPYMLAGNNIGQTIIGNAGFNTINGMGGDDMIFGLGGIDTLNGGAGKDTFYFNTALNGDLNVDQIEDFTPADDTMKLAKSIFTALTTGTLSSDAFWASTAGVAHDATDRILYEPTPASLPTIPMGPVPKRRRGLPSSA